MTPTLDSSLRAMTDDCAFRVMAVNTTQTVQDALERQAPSGITRKAFGDLITGAVLVRETMSPNQRVQAILKCRQHQGSLVADAHPTEGTRGLVSLPASEREFSLTDAILQVMRRLHDGKVHQGMVGVPLGGDVSDALRVYMQVSEQVDTLVAVTTLFDGDRVSCAGGYLIQLLPGVGRAPFAFMEERVREFGNIDAHLARGAAEIPYTELGDSPLRFGCWCSAERLLSALSTLPKADIDDFIRKGEVLEISCDYCNREYHIPPANLVGLQVES